MRFLNPAQRRIVIVLGVLLPGAVLWGGVDTAPPRLVQFETKGQGSADFYMKVTELERNAKTSRIKIVFQVKSGHISAVGGSLRLMQGCYEVARARKCEYFVNLKDWKDKDGNWTLPLS